VVSSTGLYTAPSTAGTYHVVATSVVDTTKSATAAVSVLTSLPPTTIFYDDFNGTSLNSNWTIISRHGEYSQNETECNIPQQVIVANGALTITTAAQNRVCGDFHPDGSVWHTPSSWPYITGDIQWANFNFTYGTVEIRARFPDYRSSTWPAFGFWARIVKAPTPTRETGVGTCQV
jgi:beta-glucanase (GH16 family)